MTCALTNADTFIRQGLLDLRATAPSKRQALDFSIYATSTSGRIRVVIPDLRAIRRAVRGDMPHLPLSGPQHARWSAISTVSGYGSESGALDELIALALEAAGRARTINLEELAARSSSEEADYVSQWPGEHYRLLAALAATMQPSSAVEVGTFRGHGAKAIAMGCPTTRVTTYDIFPLASFNHVVLDAADLAGQVSQRIGDLGEPSYLAGELGLVGAADLIFIDGPKDGAWEQKSLPELLSRLTDRRRLIVLDDIRLLEMVQLWHDLPYVKLDATSFGHWSGTGLLFTA
jgi:predicted O-methyltransferase YrrM